MVGVTSVTFRQLPAAEIIELAAKAKLDGIEWGADIHVPPGEVALARRIGAQTRRAGIRVFSYGSYYRLLENRDPRAAFAPVLEAAAALGAPMIRIWAGSVAPGQATAETYEQAARELRVLCGMAAGKGIQVSTEYHRGTLTQDAGSACRLLRAAACPNLHSYWQPNPDITKEQNCAELTRMRPWLSNVHVFQWRGNNVRYLLAEGRYDWPAFLRCAAGAARHYILEFVKDDSPDCFLKDAGTLKGWLHV